MKRKQILCLALAALLLLGCMTGCASSQDPTTQAPKEETMTNDPKPKQETPAPAVPLSAITNAKPLGFNAFDNQLVEYLKQAGLADENFTVSPLSFKAALAMAALGAEGETQTQLLSAMGFQSADELRAWYATVLDGTDSFEAFFEMVKEYGDPNDEALGAAAYRVVNSVWSNRDLPGEFREGFLEDIAKTCRAEAQSVPAAELGEAVNTWAKEQTKGLIPRILDDPEDAAGVSAILVNALYLKSGWENHFRKLGDRDFTTRAGETVQKPFMTQTEQMRYYKDEQTQIVSVPLQGGVSMLFVLGDDSGLAEKLPKAEYKLVELSVPMFDVETALTNRELVNYLRLMGCEKMFSKTEAEFDPMYSDELYVDDIIQKAKVHIDEKGLEAAAVTAIMEKSMGVAEPETPERFCADRPFSFYVVMDGENPELLFWGQIVK